MGTIEKILAEMLRLFNPLATRIEDGQIDLLFAELGLNLPLSANSNTAFQGILSSIKSNINSTGSNISQLLEAVEVDNTGDIISKSIEVSSNIVSIIESFTNLGNSLKNDIGSGSIGISSAELNLFVADLPKNLLNFLVVENIENNLPALGSGLELFKVIEREDIPSNGGSTQPPFTKRSLNLDELKQTITNPGKQLLDYYDWGKNTFNGSKLFAAISKILLDVGIPALYDAVNTPSELNLIFANIGIDNSGTLPGIFIEPTVEARYLPDFSIKQSQWEFKMGFISNLGENAKVSLFPDGGLELDSPSFSETTISAEWNAGTKGQTFDILSLPGGSKIDAETFGIKIQNRITDSGIGETEFNANLEKLKILIDFSEADGFISNITSGSALESEVNLQFGYSTESGLYIEGSGTIEIRLPVHIDLGPIEIFGLQISVGLGNLHSR